MLRAFAGWHDRASAGSITGLMDWKLIPPQA
jgi:hypothetical protein